MSVLKHFILWILGIARAETQTTGAERDCLSGYARGRRALAEIGVWHGVTTCRLREVMAPEGVIFAIDPYPAGRLGFSIQRVIAQHEVGCVSNGRVAWIRRTGVEAARDPVVREASGVDFLFIDGDHSYEGLRGDWEAWRTFVIPGGIVALHDSRSTPARSIDDAGSVRYIRERIALDPQYECIETVDSLTVLRRRA